MFLSKFYSRSVFFSVHHHRLTILKSIFMIIKKPLEKQDKFVSFDSLALLSEKKSKHRQLGIIKTVDIRMISHLQNKFWTNFHSVFSLFLDESLNKEERVRNLLSNDVRQFGLGRHRKRIGFIEERKESFSFDWRPFDDKLRYKSINHNLKV